MPSLSIIIPTHKRPDILRRCLEHIERQTVVDQIEVIVVSDGLGKETQSVVGALHATPFGSRIRYFEIPKSQQGIARNRGTKEAHGRFVLFIGDDIFLASNACERHLAILNSQFHTHRSFGEDRSILNFAVLGFTTWDPACGITPVMRWLERSGWQFGYSMIGQCAHMPIPPSIQHKFSYTSHISLPAEIAKNFPFREDITLYGWEDVEWGLRLKNAGIKLFYEPDAKALHHHHMTTEDSLKRMETLGRSARMMERMAPELKLVPKGFKRLKYRLASLSPGMIGKHARAFIRGAISA